MVGKAQPNPVLDSSPAIHLQNQAVEYSPNSDPYDGWDPAGKYEERLLQYVTRQPIRLALQVETDLAVFIYVLLVIGH